MNHAKNFFRSCLTCWVISLLLRFLQFLHRNFENIPISCLTVVCRDVRIGESFEYFEKIQYLRHLFELDICHVMDLVN